MRQVSKDEFDAYISEYDYYLEYNEELKVKGTTHNEYIDIKENRSDRLLGRISEFLLNHELKYVYEIQEVKTMSEIIINKEQHECPPAVAAYIKQLERNNLNLQEEFYKQGTKIDELKAENARLEEGYQKSVGVIAATDCAECKKDAETVKHGRWITDDSKVYLKHKFSECGNKVLLKYPYCENCGAKMDLKDGESE